MDIHGVAWIQCCATRNKASSVLANLAVRWCAKTSNAVEACSPFPPLRRLLSRGRFLRPLLLPRALANPIHSNVFSLFGHRSEVCEQQKANSYTTATRYRLNGNRYKIFEKSDEPQLALSKNVSSRGSHLSPDAAMRRRFEQSPVQKRLNRLWQIWESNLAASQSFPELLVDFHCQLH